jgi:hypothetical protein
MEGNSPLGGVSTKQLKTRVWDEAQFNIINSPQHFSDH